MVNDHAPEALVERTLVVLKPDAVARGLAGRIVQRFEDASLKIVGMKMREMDAEFTRRHYFDLEERLGRAVYDSTAVFMQQGPVMAMVVEGVGAVATVRKLVGSTYPDEAPPGTIRGDFAHQSKAAANATGAAVANLVHASGNREEAKYEVTLWFSEDELFDYHTATEALSHDLPSPSRQTVTFSRDPGEEAEEPVVSTEALEATFVHELTADRWAAAETAYALTVRYRQARDSDKAAAWARKTIELLDEFPSDRLDQVATRRVSVGGVTLPELLHADLVRERLADVL